MTVTSSTTPTTVAKPDLVNLTIDGVALAVAKGTLVARRAQVAVERGVKYLLVDASDDSSPILQRLGMHQVATTTPWVWTPATDPARPK